MNLCDRTSHNFRMIKKGFQIKELRNFLIWYLVLGSIVPRYDEYMYYYLTDESYMGFSKMTYAYQRMASLIGVIIGAGLFSLFLKNLPIRTMMALACLVNFIASIGQTLFIKGYYFGLNPAWLYGIIELISDAFI